MAARDRSRGFSEGTSPFRGRAAESGGAAREVQASDAKAHFAQLLDEVERGETIVILRHGRPVARLVPDTDARMLRHRTALKNLEKLGEAVHAKHGPITTEDIISSIHEGHKY